MKIARWPRIGYRAMGTRLSWRRGLGSVPPWEGWPPGGSQPTPARLDGGPGRAVIIIDLAATLTIVPIPLVARVSRRPPELVLGDVASALVRVYSVPQGFDAQDAPCPNHPCRRAGHWSAQPCRRHMIVELYQLVGDPPAVLIRCAEHPTVVDPRRFTATADSAPRILATAVMKLAQIKARGSRTPSAPNESPRVHKTPGLSPFPSQER